MTNYAEELVDLVRKDDNPEQAVLIAINTIISFLEQHESFQAPTAVGLPGQA